MLKALEKFDLSGVPPDLLKSVIAEAVTELHTPPEVGEDVADMMLTGKLLTQKIIGVREFITSPYYMNAARNVYPAVLEELIELNEGGYEEAVFTGGIGSGKSTAALYTVAYQLYVLSCYQNPHDIFGLDPASEILFVFQNLNLTLAKKGDYERFYEMLDRAPYFNKIFPFTRPSGRKRMPAELVFANRIIVKPITGQETGAIGQNVIGGILDEVNSMAVVERSKKSADGQTYDQAVALYNSLARRRESRFMDGGVLPGMLCLVSSARYPGQFTDVKIEEANANPGKIFVYDKRVWDIKPEAFSGKTFKLFLGGETQMPRIVGDDEIVTESEAAKIMLIPLEYRKQFDADLMNAVRDIAGSSTIAVHPFFTDPSVVHRAFGHGHSVIAREDIDFVLTKPQIVIPRIFNKEFPRFAHIDLGLTKDSAGLAIGYVPEFRVMERIGNTHETLPVIRYDLILEIKPPKNAEINFEKLRGLLYALRENGMPLKWITLDSYQSADTKQRVAAEGFVSGHVSMDTTTLPYDVLRQAMTDNRVEAPTHKKALMELVRLERNQKSKKIDHVPNFSKDCADAMAGVCYGLTYRREVWAQHGIPLRSVPDSLKKFAERGSNSISSKEGKDALFIWKEAA